ncbi:unnamed protein product [Symbiodinium necroappetens]|uniref:Ion transport domain-containing protein n=1 Tax=Symbiodinium necroappetens TaxID=1628268 RepID=A0A812M6V1_9DINO|nr:unnamed protein product [Symbiodinium necroappetens]
MAAGSAEERSLTEGAPRIKFACHPSTEDAEQKLGPLFSEFRSLCDALSGAAIMLEDIGAAPVLPDGFVAGNCSALLQGAAEEMLLVTRSGKDAGVRPSESDFVAVQSFDWNEWSCCFCPAKMGARPTSDTPLHWACIMKAAETFNWPERPLVALHGHALAEKEGLEKAKALKLPISHEETLFSTPEDVDALMELFKAFPYPENKVFIRKGHGFLILSSSVAAAVEEAALLKRKASRLERPVLDRIVNSNGFEASSMASIILCMFFLGADAACFPNCGVGMKDFYEVMNNVFVFLFLAEWILRVLKDGKAYFIPLKAEHVFDTLIVWVCGVLLGWVIPLTQDVQRSPITQSLNVLRSMRTLRFFNFLKTFESFKMLLAGILGTATTLAACVALLAMVDLLFGILAIELIGNFEAWGNAPRGPWPFVTSSYQLSVQRVQ